MSPGEGTPCHGGRSWSGPDPKGGGGVQTPKWLYRTMGFMGATGAGVFVLGIRQGEIFLFNPMCLYSNFVENSKMAEKHEKGF